MTGNTTHRTGNTVLLAATRTEASQVVTSADFDEQLAATYERVGLRPGMLEQLAGIRERRWWADGVSFVDGAATAAEKAIADSGVDKDAIGLMVNTSISRQYLEPATAAAIHDAIGLPRSCQNFDVTNACLGFVNGIEIASAMIDAGFVDYALVVNGEDCRSVQEATLQRLTELDLTATEVMAEFATLTLGSGAAAMVLARADRHAEGHRVVASVSRAGTEHHQLCIGDNDTMQTDLKGLLDSGLQLSFDLWTDANKEFDWTAMDRYVIHQVSQVHTDGLCDRLGLDTERVPRTFPTWGNMGPVSVPFTLAGEMDRLSPGDRVLLMGIGSGLNASCVEIAW